MLSVDAGVFVTDLILEGADLTGFFSVAMLGTVLEVMIFFFLATLLTLFDLLKSPSCGLNSSSLSCCKLRVSFPSRAIT